MADKRRRTAAEAPEPPSAAWSAALQALADDLRRRDLAARTARAYGSDLRDFARWASSEGREPAQIGPKDVRRYIAHLSALGAAPATSARKLATLRALFASQRERGFIAQNPADLVSTPRRPRHLPRVLSAREAARLLDGIPAGSALEQRDRAMFELAYACGLRAEELVSLDVADVNHDEEQVRVEGKGRKTRIVPAGEPAMAAVRRYLERARPALAGAGPHGREEGAALFLSKSGARGRSGWERCRPRLAARASPQLRHAPARRRGRSAQHPGAAGACQRLQHPDIHSGRVRKAQERVLAQPPSGIKQGSENPGDKCQTDRAAGTMAAL